MDWEKKVWGRVAHLFYSDQLGVSYLQVTSGFCCSWHLHHWRANAFLVKSGKLLIERRGEKNIHLSAGESFVVPSRVDHRFCVLESGEVIETYWPDREGPGVKLDDIHRWDEGGPYDLYPVRKFSLLEALGAEVYDKPRPWPPYSDKSGTYQFGPYHNPGGWSSPQTLGNPNVAMGLYVKEEVPKPITLYGQLTNYKSRIVSDPCDIWSVLRRPAIALLKPYSGEAVKSDEAATVDAATCQTAAVPPQPPQAIDATNNRIRPWIQLSDLVKGIVADCKQQLQQDASQEVRAQLEKYCGG